MISEATVLFVDIKDFSSIASTLSPDKLVNEINECFTEFDMIVEKYGIEKIKTIGDAYMAVGGVPKPNHSILMM
ncbi:MAG: adenylate/guanylate cyclase domain-containing protein [Saprospiraceae bacterium]|nr:adenylate/guanylate cyclase domain-containing protein [Saprospiraceae bacterium]